MTGGLENLTLLSWIFSNGGHGLGHFNEFGRFGDVLACKATGVDLSTDSKETCSQISFSMPTACH